MEDIKPALPSLAAAPLEQLITLLAKARQRREHIASVDTRCAALEAHIMSEVKAKMFAQQTKSVKIVDVGTVSMVDKSFKKTSDAPAFVEWWKKNKLQPLLDAGDDVSPALAWFSKNANVEMIDIELAETGFLPEGVEATTVTQLRFTPAKPSKGTK